MHSLTRFTWFFSITTYRRKRGTRFTWTEIGDNQPTTVTAAMAVADRSAGAYTAIESYSDSLESSVPARWSEKGTYARPKIRAENNARGVILKSRSSRVAVHSPTILFCPVLARWSRTGVFSRCACVRLSSPFPLSPLSRRFHFSTPRDTRKRMKPSHNSR